MVLLHAETWFILRRPNSPSAEPVQLRQQNRDESLDEIKYMNFELQFSDELYAVNLFKVDLNKRNLTRNHFG